MIAGWREMTGTPPRDVFKEGMEAARAKFRPGFIEQEKSSAATKSTLGASKEPGHTTEMDAAEIIRAAAELLSTVYPAEHVGKALEDLAAKAAREMTTRATATPRLKWEHDRGDDENPAAFAWRAYQAEAKAGTLHRGVIGQEDKPLAVKLASWLRSHPMPEGIDIPTKPEWITRQAEAGKAKASYATRPQTEGQRIYNALTQRRYRERHSTPT